MNALHRISRGARQGAHWAMVMALALAAVGSMTGCDTASLDLLLNSGYPINAATQNVPSWDGWAQPQYTSSLGLPESPWSYWNNFFGG